MTSRKRRRIDSNRNQKKGIKAFEKYRDESAAPSKKVPNERYPEFFMKNQIPRLKKLKAKMYDNESKRKSDEQLLRIANDLGERFRKSGYFVHKQMEINKHFEELTPYLYHETKFPKELTEESKTKPMLFSDIATHFLIEEDETKQRDMDEIQRMISINSQSQTNGDQILIEDGTQQQKKKEKDVVEVMEQYFSDEGQSEEEFVFQKLDDDEGMTGEMNEDVIDGFDGGNDW